jgi:hypothetical protein
MLLAHRLTAAALFGMCKLVVRQKETRDLSHESVHEMNKKAVHKCAECEVETEKDYYSLYYLEIADERLPDFTFSFHTPYPIGISIFPNKADLERIDHQEQEGIFRFGRTVINDEKIVFKEKEMLKRFEEAKQKFMLYFP